jgi:hypothetical protein
MARMRSGRHWLGAGWPWLLLMAILLLAAVIGRQQWSW